MRGKRYAIAEMLIAAWGAAMAACVTVAAQSAPGGPEDIILAAIETCMTGAPAPWPEAWKQEYVATIRQAIAPNADGPDYDARLDILRRGFPAYWEGLTKTKERSLFEVQAAEVRWYVEHLMAVQLAKAEEREKLRGQYAQLWDYAATALRTQFPFLDPNAIRIAQAERLAECDRQINAPLLPIFQHAFSDEQIDHIRRRWHDLRYARVDLWREIAPESATAAVTQEPPPLEAEPSLALAQRSLAQLLSQIWGVGPSAPDYYRAATRSRSDVQRRAVLAEGQARRAERALERRYSRQLFQTEHLSFLLGALLETTRQETPNQGGGSHVE